MVSGSKQADDLFCDADITVEKMKSFNKCGMWERTMFHLLPLENPKLANTDYRSTEKVCLEAV